MKFLEPIEVGGHKLDRGMFLFEFDAHREPEKTRFPQIGEWLKERVEMVEVPTPQMYWQGKFWPDFFIANQLEAIHPYQLPARDWKVQPEGKRNWPDDFSLGAASRTYHGASLHEELIEPMCRKITGRSSDEICAKYHRSIWLPLYWPQTLRTRTSLRTPFWYPKAGYAGAVAERVGVGSSDAGRQATPAAFDSADISLALVLAKPKHVFSALFVADESPIYRITDQNVCAGIDTTWHRWVVEYRGEGPLDLGAFAEDVRLLGTTGIKFSLPTIENVRRGWKPRPNINDYLLEMVNASVVA